jgi:hypothetical protein
MDVVVIGSDTAKFLDEKALESFKRQTDLEESIWRSLPLVSGGLIGAGAITGSIANSRPQPSTSPFALLTYGCVSVAVALFGASIWWLWQVIKPREFEYLPDDALVADYAERLSQFHSERGLSVDVFDNAVAAGLRSFMRDAYVKSAKSTFDHNQERLSARSQVIFFLLWGFVLAFAADGLVTGHRLLYGKPETEAVTNGNKTPAPQPAAPSGVAGSPAPTSSTADAYYSGRGVADQVQYGSTGAGQRLNGGRRDTTPRSGPSTVR